MAEEDDREMKERLETIAVRIKAGDYNIKDHPAYMRESRITFFQGMMIGLFIGVCVAHWFWDFLAGW